MTQGEWNLHPRCFSTVFIQYCPFLWVLSRFTQPPSVGSNPSESEGRGPSKSGNCCNPVVLWVCLRVSWKIFCVHPTEHLSPFPLDMVSPSPINNASQAALESDYTIHTTVQEPAIWGTGKDNLTRVERAASLAIL